MSYVIYNKETTKIWEVCRSGRMYGTHSFKTEGQAKAALTREVNKGKVVREDFRIAEMEFYKEHLEATETFTINGKTITQSINTPWACDPRSETYWCS